jgi:hypothetical protein
MSEDQKRAYKRPLKAYIVTSEDEERIVRAHTPAEALKHCTPTFSVRAATHDDIIELMASGVAGGDRGPARSRPGRRKPGPD